MTPSFSTIRKGIHWAVDPDNAMSRLVGGRELDAYDVEFNIKRNFNMLPTYPEPNAYALVRLTPNEYPVSVTVTDKWTVMLKGRAGFLGSTFYYIGQAVTILAPEVVKAGKNFEDLKNYVSNGPFILKDYVRASATTFIRNPNYWRKDPVGPGKGNQLPYLDGVKYLIIPDVSTRVAALRTSKTDSERLLSQENADSLLKTSPQLLKTAIVKGGWH
ncbi:MAG: hypothetical protein HYU83_04780 [Chloroflexi bacterium]|nr:hypothetical protein [Chloroflexota bacterium]